tara:strand:+ start:246 stop:1637 length:1392 start_codon:yes stop_codon:yes gene_type:complete
MPKDYKKSIFIFRRDLRIVDNLGLLKASKLSETVIPIFILTPEQLKKNPYKSDNCVQFMMETLEELDQSLKKSKSKLFYFYGTPSTVLKKILNKDTDIEAVYVNYDVTPYSKKRDESMKKVCDSLDVEFVSNDDLLLNPVGSITTSGDKDVYQKFTPYYNKAKSKTIAKPDTTKIKNFAGSSTKIVGQYTKSLTSFYKKNPKNLEKGGRKAGLEILKDIKEFKDYDKKRDCFDYQTTHLSGYLKFGCVSIREAYHAIKSKLGARSGLLRQLYWRDFYHNITWGFPHVIGGPMKKEYKPKWDTNATLFNKWKQGKTGFPIVDANMRAMNETGFMHNRGRMIVSSFLVKIMLMDWKKGEKYFAQTLYDYDVSNNNGGWQWSASTGADSQPYFRIFNPWLQSEKYDKEAKFIKKWIPELNDIPAKHLHKWDKFWKEHPEIKSKYPQPVVDYAKNKEESIRRYKKLT